MGRSLKLCVGLGSVSMTGEGGVVPVAAVSISGDGAQRGCQDGHGPNPPPPPRPSNNRATERSGGIRRARHSRLSDLEQAAAEGALTARALRRRGGRGGDWEVL